MSPFEFALAAQHPVRLRPGEDWDPFANIVVIGPGPFDMTAAGHGQGVPQQQLQREAKQIRNWRRFDWYRHGQ